MLSAAWAAPPDFPKILEKLLGGDATPIRPF